MAKPVSTGNVQVTFNCKTVKQNEEWCDTHEHILYDWKTKAFIDMWLQRESANYFSFIDNILMYPIILLSSCAGITLFVSATTWSVYLVSVANIFVTILTALGQQLKPNEMCQQYTYVACRYAALIRSVDTCLELPRLMRPDPDVLIEKIGSEIDHLNTTQLAPPTYIINRFERIYGPIHLLMFGDDILQLLFKDLTTLKRFRKLMVTDDINKKKKTKPEEKNTQI